MNPFLPRAGETGASGQSSPPRVAVVGSGIAGLAAAHALTSRAQVSLYEAAGYFGGHAHTVDVAMEGLVHGVDTGFLVFNERTYPNLIRLFRQLGVETAASEMSFSVQVRPRGLEWCGSNLGAVFAQRRNLVSPRFWRMLVDIARFNSAAASLAQQPAAAALAGGCSLGEYLDRGRYSQAFLRDYLLPMVGCIWSCPTEQMLAFPLGTLLQFLHNHGLLQLSRRPQWYTVRGGARRYVQRMLQAIADARLNTPVRRIQRLPAGAGGVLVHTDAGGERFDTVILACHSDQALALLAEPSADERAVLGAIGWQRNRAVLHTDAGVLPRQRRAWAAWNYESAIDPATEKAGVCVHYLLNRLQPLPFRAPVLVSLNPVRPLHRDRVITEFDYAHPVFDAKAIAAQQRLPELQGRGRVWFCGAWTRHGFHEDGLSSAWAVAEQLLASRVAESHHPAQTAA